MAIVGFAVVALVAVAGALGVVMNRNPLYSALSLVGVFVATAFLYFMLNAPFLGVLQILVYAGAIMVLFIFVVMLLSLRYQESGEEGGIPTGFKRVAAVLLAGFLVAQFVMIGVSFHLTGAHGNAEVGSVEAVGLTLYRKYVYPFEVASILLLVAIIGAVAITRRHGRGLEGHVGEEEAS